MSSGSHTGPGRLQEVEDIFHAALEQQPEQLAAFLDTKCAGDRRLRGEVEALLASHQRAGSFIEDPVAALDARIFEDAPADALIDQTLGHYRIIKPIGIGGMGAVYLAERSDRQYKKLVAIKLIRRGMDIDAVLRHFQTERQILADFDHPNIARLLDGGTTPDSGHPYFVMEYVEGLPVDAYCDAQALTITQRLRLFLEVCAAVSYAHRHAVIHRDIKPSNILVSTDGVPKLLDFGIAKMLQQGEGAELSATIGLRLMTPEYASPEQVRGDPLTTATDVYSLGVVLYRLLTGRSPYRLSNQSSYDTARAISEAEPQKPSTIAAAAPDASGRDGTSERLLCEAEGGAERLQRRLRGDLDNIALMALRKEPERRYQSVEQFAEDIRRHLENLPVLARKDTLGYRSAKFIRRNRAATVAGVLVVLSLLGGIALTSWQAHRASVQEAAAKAEKARAERRFNDVRRLANSVLFDYHDAIADLPGATAVRERLVKDALVYLDSLAKEAAGDTALQRELAAAYDKVGDVRGRAYAASLGDPAGAMDSYQKALRIREAIVAAAPQDVQSRRDLAASYFRIGNQLIEADEPTRGLEYLRQGFGTYVALAAEQPGRVEIQEDLAEAYNDVGLALESWDAAAAMENHRKALSLREGFVAAEPGNQRHRRNLSLSYVNLGRALVLKGDIKGGLESNRKGLLIRDALFAEDPHNADYRRLLGIAYQNDGDYRAFLHDIQGALQSFRKKLALDKQAMADDPLNMQSRGDFAYSCERMGFLLAESRAYSQALRYLRQALNIFSEPGARNVSVDLREILTRSGVSEMEARLGNREAALAEGERALAQVKAMALDGFNSGQQSMRGQIYMRLARAQEALATTQTTAAGQHEHWLAARNLYARSLEVWQDMQKRGILTGEDANKPREVSRLIARCETFLRK